MMDRQGINPAELEAEDFQPDSSADGCSFPQEAGVSKAVNDYTEKFHDITVNSHYCNGLEECLKALKDYQDGKLGLTRVLLKRFADTTKVKCAGDNDFAQNEVKHVDMERVYLRK